MSFPTKSVLRGRRFCCEEEAVFGRIYCWDLEVGGPPVSELCREHGISEPSYYRWEKLCGSMKPSKVRELSQLREENSKLKRLVADLSLDKAMLQDVLQKKVLKPTPRR